MATIRAVTKNTATPLLTLSQAVLSDYVANSSENIVFRTLGEIEFNSKKPHAELVAKPPLYGALF